MHPSSEHPHFELLILHPSPRGRGKQAQRLLWLVFCRYGTEVRSMILILSSKTRTYPSRQNSSSSLLSQRQERGGGGGVQPSRSSNQSTTGTTCEWQGLARTCCVPPCPDMQYGPFESSCRYSARTQMVLTFPCKIGTWYLVPGTSTSQRTLVPADSCLKQVEGLSTHSSRLCTAATARRRRFTAITTQVYINPQHFYSLPRYPQPKPKIPTYANPNQTKAAKY